MPGERCGEALPGLHDELGGDRGPDPFYGGPEGFERVLDLVVEEASEGCLEDIRERHLKDP